MPHTYYFQTEYGTFYKTNDPYGAPFNQWGNPPVRVTKADYKQDRIEQIKKYVKEGDTLHTIVTHVARTGMSRHIRVFAIVDNDPVDLSSWIAGALDMRYIQKSNSVMIGGCGMDMGFALVYDLAHALFGDGYALNQRWL